MKIERLIAIIIILLQNKKVTASYLSDRFHVSKRTIYRDMTDLCLAGIPIVTIAGSNGGIMISDDYKLDKTLFTEKELQAILAGLLSLDSISLDCRYQNIIDKFMASKDHIYTNHVMIDLSSHYKDSLAIKIACLQQAIDLQKFVEFDYYNASGHRKIRIAPYLIVFQWSSWYVFGSQSTQNKFKLYKLNRLCDINIVEEYFELQDIPSELLNFNQYFTESIKSVILFDQSLEYRLIEEYGKDCYEIMNDGKLKFSFSFTNKEYLLEWVLSFGDKAEMLEPVEMRKELKKRIEDLYNKYF